MFLLDIEPAVYRQTWEHLLPKQAKLESAAFLFATWREEDENVIFTAMDQLLLSSGDFTHQLSNYLVLSDDTRVNVIRAAHSKGTCLVEIHSHLGPWPAAFSLSDVCGLEETVAHMWWRLPERPYIAIVVAESGYDALVWWGNPHTPRELGGIRVGKKLLKPTNQTIGGWGNERTRVSV